MPWLSSAPMGSKRRRLLIALYAGVLVGGLLLGRQFVVLSDFLDPANEVYLDRIINTVVVIYVLVAALPFVPAAEIGLCLMLLLEPTIAVVVYTSTVLALMLAYLVGRIIPVGACATAFEFFGFGRARKLVLEMAALDADERLQLLLTNTCTGARGPWSPPPSLPGACCGPEPSRQQLGGRGRWNRALGRHERALPVAGLFHDRGHRRGARTALFRALQAVAITATQPRQR